MPDELDAIGSEQHEQSFAKENPWVKFFFDDWLNDEDLQICSFAAQGLWMAMLGLMRRGRPYGFLQDKRGAWTPERIAGKLEKPIEHVQELIKELEGNGVFSRDKNNVIYSRRLRRDYEKSVKRSEAGTKGSDVKYGKPHDEPLAKPVANGVAKPVANGVAKDVANSSRTCARASDSALASDSEANSEELNKYKTSTALELVKASSPVSFGHWWNDIWSPVRGTNHKNQAAQAWISIDGNARAPAIYACTESYLKSLENAAKGYNPENFLFEQARDDFTARWPPHQRVDKKAAATTEAIRRMKKEMGYG